jgi:hypothetical protein
MTGDRCSGCGRVWSWAGLALAPLLLPYALWVAGGRLADLACQRRSRRGRA